MCMILLIMRAIVDQALPISRLDAASNACRIKKLQRDRVILNFTKIIEIFWQKVSVATFCTIVTCQFLQATSELLFMETVHFIKFFFCQLESQPLCLICIIKVTIVQLTYSCNSKIDNKVTTTICKKYLSPYIWFRTISKDFFSEFSI